MKKADIVALEMIHRVEIASRFFKSMLASTKSILDSKSEMFNGEGLMAAVKEVNSQKTRWASSELKTPPSTLQVIISNKS